MLITLRDLQIISRQTIEMSSRCSIFCETEVHHYLQWGAGLADLGAGINRTMSARVMALVRRLGVEKEVTMTGGVAKNPAVLLNDELLLATAIRETSGTIAAETAALIDLVVSRGEVSRKDVEIIIRTGQGEELVKEADYLEDDLVCLPAATCHILRIRN